MLDLYETFYRLSADPFRLSPDHRFVLDHRTYAKSRSYLEYALHRGEGFIVITGGAGTGKTTLINEILAQLDKTQIQVATLTSTQLESRDLLHMVAASFGLPQRDTDKAGFLLDLEEFLKQQGQRRRRAVLIVDEAQGLSPGALEELRLLANLQFNNRLLLQVFLVGQEPLRELIGQPEMDHLRQRIVAASHIEALKLDETVDYVEHRLTRVGWDGDPKIDAEALTMIHAYSGGIPRKINLICSRLFLYGAMEKKHALTSADTRNVIEDLQQEHLMEPMARQGNGTTGTLSRIGMPAEEFSTASIAGLPREKKTPDRAAVTARQQPSAEEADEQEANTISSDEERGSGPEIRDIREGSGRQTAGPSSGERDIWGEIEELKQELEDSYEELETQAEVKEENPPENRTQPARTVWPATDATTTATSPGQRSTDTRMRAERRDRHGSRRDESRGRGRRIITALVILLAAAGITASLVFDTDDIGHTVATMSERLVGPQKGTIQRDDAGIERQAPVPAQLPETEGVEEPVKQAGSIPPVETSPVDPGTGEAAPVAEVSSGPADAMESETDAELGAETGEASVADITVASRAGSPLADSPVEAADQPVDEPVAEDSADIRAEQQPVETNVASAQPPAKVTRADEESVVAVVSAPPLPEPVARVEKAVTGTTQQADVSPVAEVPQTRLEEQRKRLHDAAEKRLTQRLAGRQAATEKKTDKVTSLAGGRLAAVEKPKVVPPRPAKPKTKPATSVTASRPASKPAGLSATPESIRSTLLGGDWTSRGKPATLFPSEITHCQPQARGLACWSVPQEVTTKYGPAVYKVEATLADFSAAGNFRLTYRTLVRLVTDDATATDSGRWQITEHSMTCQLTPLSKILCRDTKGIEREYRRS